MLDHAPRDESTEKSTGALADGMAMSLAAGGAAVVGMLSWLYVARTVSAADVGRAAAFVAAFQVVAGCTEINLGVALLRWLPHAGSRTSALLTRCAVAVAALSAVAGALYLLVPGAATVLDALGGDRPALTAAVFVAACVGWALFQQQDFVLVGLGRPWWAPARTGLFAATRVAVFVVAGGALSAAVVVWSWVLPMAVCVAAAGVTTWWWSRGTRTTEHDTLPRRREVLGFLGPTYVGQVGVTLLVGLVPLTATIGLGPDLGGRFFLLWQGVTVVDVVAQYFVSSLAGAVARDPDHGEAHRLAARRRLLVLMTPALLLGVALAHPVLLLFGPAYAAHADALRVLLVGVAFRLWVVHRLGAHQAFGRSVRFATLSVVSTALVVGGVLATPWLARTASTVDPLVLLAGCYAATQAGCVLVLAAADAARARTARTTRADPTTQPA